MSRFTYPKFQAPDNNGENLAGGLVYFYIPSSSTPKDTYADRLFATPNANPVVLDSRGEADIYLNGSYKVILKTADDVEIWTQDPYQGLEAALASTVTGLGASMVSFESGATVQDLASTTSATLGSYLVGVFLSATGYVGRTLSAWIVDRPYYVQDFGGVLNGTTDDSVALAACLAAGDHIIINNVLAVASTVSLSSLTNKKIEFQGAGEIKAVTGLGANPVVTIGGTASGISFIGKAIINANSIGTHCIYLTGTASEIDFGYATYKNTTTGGTQNSAIYIDGVHTNLRMERAIFRGNASAAIIHHNTVTTSIDGFFINELDYNGSNVGATQGSCMNMAALLTNFQFNCIRAKIPNTANATILGLDDALGGIISNGNIGSIIGEGTSTTDTLNSGVVISRCTNLTINSIMIKNLGYAGVEISETDAAANKNISIGNVVLANVGATAGLSGLALIEVNGGVTINSLVIDSSSGFPTRGIGYSNAKSTVIGNVVIKGTGSSGGESGLHVSTTSIGNKVSNLLIDGFAGTGIRVLTGCTNNTFSSVDITSITESGKRPILCDTGSSGNYFDGVTLRSNTLAPLDTPQTNAIRYAPKVIEVFADADTTPSIAGNKFWLTANTGATTVTAFDDSWHGEILSIMAGDNNTTLTHGASIVMNTGANKTLSSGKVYMFVRYSGAWHEVAA